MNDFLVRSYKAAKHEYETREKPTCHAFIHRAVSHVEVGFKHSESGFSVFKAEIYPLIAPGFGINSVITYIFFHLRNLYETNAFTWQPEDVDMFIPGTENSHVVEFSVGRWNIYPRSQTVVCRSPT